MLVSRAFGHGTIASESSGGGNALLIILGVGILFRLVYMGRKRWRRRKAVRDDDGATQDT